MSERLDESKIVDATSDELTPRFHHFWRKHTYGLYNHSGYVDTMATTSGTWKNVRWNSQCLLLLSGGIVRHLENGSTTQKRGCRYNHVRFFRKWGTVDSYGGVHPPFFPSFEGYITTCQSKKRRKLSYTSLWVAETFTFRLKISKVSSAHIWKHWCHPMWNSFQYSTNLDNDFTGLLWWGAVAQPLAKLLYLLQSACLYTSNKSRSPPASPAHRGEHDITRDYHWWYRYLFVIPTRQMEK